MEITITCTCRHSANVQCTYCIHTPCAILSTYTRAHTRTHTHARTHTYRSVPLIRPPILYTTSSPKRGVGVFSSTQLVSIIRPLKTFCYVYDTAKQGSCSQLQKYKRSPVLLVVIMRGLPTSARRAALQLEGHNIHDDFAVAILKNSNTVGHEPRNISWYFLWKSGSEMTCTVDVNSDYSI